MKYYECLNNECLSQFDILPDDKRCPNCNCDDINECIEIRADNTDPFIRKTKVVKIQKII